MNLTTKTAQRLRKFQGMIKSFKGDNEVISEYMGKIKIIIDFKNELKEIIDAMNGKSLKIIITPSEAIKKIEKLIQEIEIVEQS